MEHSSPVRIPVVNLHPGVGSVRAKVIQEWDTTHERMLQSGILGDETGTIKFVIWKEPGKEKIDVGSVYNIFYAMVDEFNGRLSLNLNTATIMQDDGDIEVSGGNVADRERGSGQGHEGGPHDPQLLGQGMGRQGLRVAPLRLRPQGPGRGLVDPAQERVDRHGRSSAGLHNTGTAYVFLRKTYAVPGMAEFSAMYTKFRTLPTMSVV